MAGNQTYGEYILWTLNFEFRIVIFCDAVKIGRIIWRIVTIVSEYMLFNDSWILSSFQMLNSSIHSTVHRDDDYDYWLANSSNYSVFDFLLFDDDLVCVCKAIIFIIIFYMSHPKTFPKNKTKKYRNMKIHSRDTKTNKITYKCKRTKKKILSHFDAFQIKII